MGCVALPDSEGATRMDPEKVVPPSNNTWSPGKSFWELTRRMVRHAALVARPELLSLPEPLT